MMVKIYESYREKTSQRRNNSVTNQRSHRKQSNLVLLLKLRNTYNFFGKMEDLKCGLIYILNKCQVPVPLKKVQLQVKVVNFISEVNIIQDYVNHEADPIEVLYSFPVEESAAIIGFEASINDHVIVSQVKEKEKAQAEYQQAMRVRLYYDILQILRLQKIYMFY